MRRSPGGVSRRAFLKLCAVGGVALWFQPAGPAAEPALASALPLPYPHQSMADADGLLTPEGRRHWSAFDLWLIPAYTAAALIQHGAVQALTVPAAWARGRAHDPDGAFTRPHAWAASVLAEGGWADVPWPASARLVLGAALMRRGYSPNDAQPHHLAEIEQDLLAQHPAALTWHLLSAGPALPRHLAWPAAGAMVVEYDWVIPREAPHPAAAMAFLRRLVPQTCPRLAPVRQVPLTPLSAEALARRAALWARLRSRQPVEAAVGA